MTVAIGLKFQEDIVLAADREESDSYLRDQVQKIQRLGFPNKMIVGITGAGDAHFIDFSAEEIKNYLWANPRVPLSQVGQRIEAVLKEIFAEHIFATNLSARERPDFELLIACCHHGIGKLFKTKQAAPIEISDFAACGYGASYAEILLRNFWGTLTLHSAVLLALHVVHQTQKHVCSVGGGTDVVILKSNGKSATISSALTKPLSEKLEKLDYQFEGAFFSAFMAKLGYRMMPMISGIKWPRCEANYKTSYIDFLRFSICEFVLLRHPKSFGCQKEFLAKSLNRLPPSDLFQLPGPASSRLIRCRWMQI